MSLYIIGIGPGDEKGMTIKAREALAAAEIIVGYQGYTELLKGFYPEKIYRSTPMGREEARCRMALAEAAAGRSVAIVCSGDAGVYGMAGLVYELAVEYPHVEIEIIAGVTAALSGAALIGAPLGHDFAVISLSDILTPWEIIEKRLHKAASADFALCLYNPASRKRRNHLKKACAIIMEYRPADTVCAYARNIGRMGEETKVLTLGALSEAALDMFTTVFIGSSATRRIGDKMVNPRGYVCSEAGQGAPTLPG